MKFIEKISVKSSKPDEVYSFWEKSNQRTIFTNPKFIETLNYKFSWWTAYYGDEKICIWPVCTSKDKITIPDFFYYFGPLWTTRIIQAHRWLYLSTNIYYKIFEKLIKEFGYIENQLHYSLADVRAFDWWNFNSGKKFQILPKYSAILENLNNSPIEKIIEEFRCNRRREIKKFQKKFKIVIENDLDFKTITLLYTKIMEDQKEEILKHSIDSLYNIYKSLKNFGSIIVIKNLENNEIVSFSLLLNDFRTSNLVLNANNRSYFKYGSGSMLITETIKYLKKKKFDILDFNGANSPNRGDDKHSYGSNYKLYFHIKYES